ncbi:MAG: glutathione synthase [Saprospiraceae bacterium]|jgi:glutathione synthase
MRHAFIMDPLEGVKPWKDTSYFIMLAAAQKGDTVCFLQQHDLFLLHDQLNATVVWVEVNDDNDEPFTKIKTEAIAMSTMDAVWLRTDPPFDRRYFYTTLLLDFLPAHVQILNRPEGVRNWNEKLAALKYPEFTPRTCISNQVEEILTFSRQHDRITLKPIDGFGGKGIFFFSHGDDEALLAAATHQGSHWVIAQEFLPAAAEGDKRILLVQGEPIGGILRVHAPGQELNNLDMGGTAVASELDADDLAICQALKPGLIDQGVFFVGVDVIGGKLIEVNVTSPTGLQELCQFSSVNHHHNMIDALHR